jgi:hypothetical protein
VDLVSCVKERSNRYFELLLDVLQILATQVCDFDRIVCNSQAALNSTSKAVIQIQNTGTERASFSTSLGGCSYPVVPVSAQNIILSANGTGEVVFEVSLRQGMMLSCKCSGGADDGCLRLRSVAREYGTLGSNLSVVLRHHASLLF